MNRGLTLTVCFQTCLWMCIMIYFSLQVLSVKPCSLWWQQYRGKPVTTNFPIILRRIPPEVRVTSGHKFGTKIVYNCAIVVNIFSKEIIYVGNVWTLYETLESAGKKNWWWNFVCVCTNSLIFEFYFLSFPWENVFGVISGNYLCSLKKCKNNRKKT